MEVDISLLIDLHKEGQRQGPGDDRETRRALELGRVDPSQPLEIADIGCGTGASTLCLARQLKARITAVDFLEDFLEILQNRAAEAGLRDSITTRCASMEDLPFAEGEFDVLWSEGAVYNMGFEKGIAAWRRFLKPGGLLAVSEITWITASRPPEIQAYWESEYPEINGASARMRLLEQHGYALVGYFTLPAHCWLENYYLPLQERFDAFLQRQANSPEARAVVALERREIELFQQYQAYYSYGFYLARKEG